MIENLFIFIVSLLLIIKGATLSTKYAFELAENFKLSKYVVGFIVIAIISIIPEIFITINSALEGVPALGLGTLFGGNIADMTIVFAIVIFFAGRSIKVDSKILKENIVYPFILLIPIILGLDGYYSRIEGLGLVITGLIFYYLAFRNNKEKQIVPSTVIIKNKNRLKNTIFLLLSMSLLLIGSHFIVTSTINISNYLGVNSVVIGMLIVGVGTTMPELFFCLSAIRKNHDSLAVGDILGTVLADATVVVGLLALISPFYFPQRIIYSAGIFMVISSFILFYFMRSGRALSKKESYLLLSFWVLFVFVEILLNS
jgi:cation:H+ antiporter